MTWNYRIVKYAKGDGYGLHEVHYDGFFGSPISMTTLAVGFAGETPEEILEALKMAKQDIERQSIFDEPIEWTNQKD